MNRDKKSFDTYSLVLGVLGAIAIVVLVVAIKLSGNTRGDIAHDTAEYQAAVAERIRPLGEVYLPGEDFAYLTGETAVEPEPVATVMSGPQVYNSACIACHSTGVGGAPTVGDTDAWAPRIAQGIDTLNDHAINGGSGSSGVRSARGGRMDLSDSEDEDAVLYMVNESQ